MSDQRRVYVRTSSGEWHAADRDEHGRKSLEQCNLDDALITDETDALPEYVEPENLCGWCMG